jgi:hypothetical protein
MHATIPGARLVVLPDVGHMVDMQAADRCNAEIRAFVDEVERTGALPGGSATTPVPRAPDSRGRGRTRHTRAHD